MRSAVLIAVMSAVTVALRALPFIVFKRQTPPWVANLGRVLPPAIIGMLVVYCLKDVSLSARPFGLPEAAAVACVAGVQALKRNSLLSILAGTALYMTLIQLAL